MLDAIVRAALSQRLVVLVVAAALLAFGLNAARKLSVDAFPDVTNVQVQIATEAPGRSPEEVERFVTAPVEVAMTGLPALMEMRSLNKPGLSLITLVFSDATDVYFARQLVLERLIEIGARLPVGVTPVLGPVSTALGEVYQYTLERPDDGKRELTRAELTERRTAQDWVVRPLLRSIPGVAEINSTGGHVKQYQVLVDPDRLRYFKVSIHDVWQALARNNANSGGGVLPQRAEQYLVRGIGLVRNLDDIRDIVLKEVGGTPVYVRDVAEVTLGEEVRHGAMIKDGHTEAVGGVVMMIRAGNAKEVVSRVKARVAEINARGMLPGGLQVVPYYDRSELVDAALWTVVKVLLEGVLFVVVVLVLFLGDLRSSLIVVATLVLTPLATFIVMNRYGISANLMSLGGLAIAIGLMVDGSVVVIENAYGQLGKRPGEPRARVIFESVREVATPVVFGVGIIILVFLPLMTLSGMEGKMFAPLAYTIAIALAISLVLSLTLTPALASFLLKGGAEHDTWLIATLKRPYLALLQRALANRKRTVGVAVALFVATLALVPFLGTAFIPEMKEGSITPSMDRVPNISLDESIQMEKEAMRRTMEVPGVKSAVSRLGRGESAADPAGPNESDPIVSLKPRSEWPSGWTQDDIAAAILDKLRTMPGVQLVMAQPISDRVDEMVTGVRSDVAVKVFGDDLEVLRAKANEIARVAGTVRGVRDMRVERTGGQQYLTIAIDRQAIARQGAQRVGRAGRDRDGRGRQGGHRDLRGRAALPGRRAPARAPARQRGRDPRDHPDRAERRAGGARQPCEDRGRRRPGAGQPRVGQAPDRGRDQREGPRPRRFRRRAAGGGRRAGADARGVLPGVGRAVREPRARARPPQGHRAGDDRRDLLPALPAVQFASLRGAHHHRAAVRLDRRHHRARRDRRIPVGAGVGGLHRAVGHRGAERRGARQLHPQVA